MCFMLSVSTKTGDSGKTSSISGERLPKNHAMFQAVGSVDELNSWLGLLAVKLQVEFDQYREQLQQIQEWLFYLGAECAGSKKVSLKSDHLEQLEAWSENLQKSMEGDWHSQFVLPGGTELGAHLDVARTVCRRAERDAVALSEQAEISNLALKFLNRLSDYLYVLRCFVNHAVSYQENFFVVREDQK